MLLEVVLALALFVAAAAVITSGLNASVQAVERLRMETHAENLAITVLAELQAGIRSSENAGGQAFEPPFEEWTYELSVSALGEESFSTNQTQRVEVVVRHVATETTRRLTQMLRVRPASLSSTNETTLEDWLP